MPLWAVQQFGTSSTCAIYILRRTWVLAIPILQYAQVLLIAAFALVVPYLSAALVESIGIKIKESNADEPDNQPVECMHPGYS